jgi:CheY-like chemotaxis protein
MIAESDPFISQLLSRFAEESGVTVVQVRLGQDLPETARQIKPGVIIVEAELPGDISGWQAVRSVRMDPETADIPVVSCSWMNEVEVRSLIPGLAGHLQKPNLYYADFVRALNAAGIANGAQLHPRRAEKGT